MEFRGVTYVGQEPDDEDLFGLLPPELSEVIQSTNGLVAFRGGFHLRGACVAPAWHSLRAAWLGSESFASRYPGLLATDIPFAEDALGDQFILREGQVFRLAAETGDIETTGRTLLEFLDATCQDPVGVLGLEPLLRFEADGGHLVPGQLLSAYPPFCTREAAKGVSFRAVPAAERLAFLADFAAVVSAAADGSAVEFKLEP